MGMRRVGLVGGIGTPVVKLVNGFRCGEGPAPSGAGRTVGVFLEGPVLGLGPFSFFHSGRGHFPRGRPQQLSFFNPWVRHESLHGKRKLSIVSGGDDIIPPLVFHREPVLQVPLGRAPPFHPTEVSRFPHLLRGWRLRLPFNWPRFLFIGDFPHSPPLSRLFHRLRLSAPQRALAGAEPIKAFSGLFLAQATARSSFFSKRALANQIYPAAFIKRALL